MHKLRLLIAALAALAPIVASAQLIPAFPGAEGAGAFATGGRPIEKLNYKTGATSPTLEKRGVVYHVTTLDPDPDGVIPGSLRYGLKNENFWYSTHPFAPMDINVPDTFDVTPRTIVFDVGGTINLGEMDFTPMNFTIAGQTAPGGITIYGGEFNPGHRDAWDSAAFYPDKTNNLVLRNFAVRTHDANEKDGLWLATSNSIADHLSLAWYTDEGVSITDAARNVTVQHSIIGPGWNNPDGDGSQIEGKTPMADISVHHNLYIHNDARIVRVGEKAATGAPGVELDFRNNVIFNWNDGSAGYSVPGEPSFTNFVNNYYINGPGNSPFGSIFSSGGTLTRIYQSGNFLDFDRDGIADGGDPGWAGFDGTETQAPAPYTVPHGVTQLPGEALATVQAYSGSRWWDRDFLDVRSLAQLATFGQGSIAQTGQVSNTVPQADVDLVTGAPMQSRPAGYDTDNDGMPNDWEVQYGLNPQSPPESPDWIQDYDGDGYINIEEYINEIAEWPAPYEIVFTGGTNSRFEQITNWSITRSSPGEAATTTHWQPSKFDAAAINSGTVSMNSIGQHAGSLRLATGAADNATLNITDGWLKVEDMPFGLGSGEILIGAAATSTAALNLSGGELIVKSLNLGPGGSFNFTGGVLAAATVGFDLVNNGGTLAPSAPTRMTQVLGDLALNSGSIEIDLASATAFDKVSVAGVATLGGELDVVLLDGFVPASTDVFEILTGNSLVGTFADAATSLDVGAGTFDVTYTAASVLLSNFTSAAPVLPGDFNDDGAVDAADYVVWRKSIGTPAAYDDWRSHFGQTANTGSGTTSNDSVPEPASLILLTVVAAGGWMMCRRSLSPLHGCLRARR
jgi:hypothetical protein